jgi:hypothetical protein
VKCGVAAAVAAAAATCDVVLLPDSDVFIFMLSLRAGGVGLNLQAADTVIMYDRCDIQGSFLCC